MKHSTFISFLLMILCIQIRSQNSNQFVEINSANSIIQFFPKKPKDAKLTRYQIPEKQVWLDAIRIDDKTRQIRITARPDSRVVNTLVKFKYPFSDASVTWNMQVKREDDIISVLIPWNGMLIGERMDVDEGGNESEAMRNKLGVAGISNDNLPLIYSSGDSISLGYWPYLENELWEYISIYYQRELWADIPETRSSNNGHANNAYTSLQKAFKNENFKPDYILINFGLHMLNKFQNNLDAYGAWIQKFIDLSKKQNVKLIWVTTTPYAMYQNNKNIIVQNFNKTATEIVSNNHMYTIDLYGCVVDLIKKYNEWNVYTDGLHYKEEIKAKQAEFLALQLQKIVEEN